MKAQMVIVFAFEINNRKRMPARSESREIHCGMRSANRSMNVFLTRNPKSAFRNAALCLLHFRGISHDSFQIQASKRIVDAYLNDNDAAARLCGEACVLQVWRSCYGSDRIWKRILKGKGDEELKLIRRNVTR